VDDGSLCNLTRVGRRPEWGEAKIRDGRWVLPFLVHPGGVPPLVVVLQGDLEARLEIGRRRARMQVEDELDVADSGLLPVAGEKRVLAESEEHQFKNSGEHSSSRKP